MARATKKGYATKQKKSRYSDYEKGKGTSGRTSKYITTVRKTSARRKSGYE